MNSLFKLSATSAIAGLLVVAGSAQAGEHDITAQEVEAYFKEVAQEATEFMRAEELHRMIEWIDEHFADGAVLQASMNVVHGEERKGFLSFTLDKDDLTRWSGLMVGSLQHMEIEDFSVEVEVLDVVSHGPGAATATTRWTETLAIVPPQAGEGAEPAGEALTMEEVVDCTQIVQRNGERLQMGLMTCTGEIRF
jgi:hypothetical protein